MKVRVAPVAHASNGTMTVSGSPAARADDLRWVSNCPGPTAAPEEIAFDDRCGASADVLLLAYDVVGGVTGTVLVKYIHLPARPIIDGGTVAIDPDTWVAPERVTVTFVHGSVRGYSVSTSFGITANAQDRTVPIAGTMHVSGNPCDTRFLAAFSVATATTNDLDRVDAPHVEKEPVATEHQVARDGRRGRCTRRQRAVQCLLVAAVSRERRALDVLARVWPGSDRGLDRESTIATPARYASAHAGLPRRKTGMLVRVECVDPAHAPQSIQLTTGDAGSDLSYLTADLLTTRTFRSRRRTCSGAL